MFAQSLFTHVSLAKTLILGVHSEIQVLGDITLIFTHFFFNFMHKSKFLTHKSMPETLLEYVAIGLWGATSYWFEVQKQCLPFLFPLGQVQGFVFIFWYCHPFIVSHFLSYTNSESSEYPVLSFFPLFSKYCFNSVEIRWNNKSQTFSNLFYMVWALSPLILLLN